MRSLRSSAGLWRHVCLTLAVLAVAIKVLVPAGFMVGKPTATNDMPFALVLCTGDGMTVVQPGDTLPDHNRNGESDKASHDAPCAFAGHGATAPPPSLLDPATVEFIAYVYNPPVAFDGLSPGRGLAGPPLPARGPPAQLI